MHHKKTLGLIGMKERTFMMGGKYVIMSQIGKGTSVLVSVPVE
jgi:signal transduction histidine kinase